MTVLRRAALAVTLRLQHRAQQLGIVFQRRRSWPCASNATGMSGSLRACRCEPETWRLEEHRLSHHSAVSIVLPVIMQLRASLWRDLISPKAGCIGHLAPYVECTLTGESHATSQLPAGPPGSGCARTRNVHRPFAVVPSTTLAGRAVTSGASAGENTVSRKATSGADT